MNIMELTTLLAKSAKKIDGLHYIVASATELLIENCYRKGIWIQVTQGLRTIAEQNALYAQGRTTPGQIVTNAKGGTSYHNYGLSIDFVLLKPDGKTVTWDLNTDFNSNNVKDWSEVVTEAKKLGFEWGGDWVSIKDYPHFQITFGLSISDLKNGKTPSQKLLDSTLAVVNKGRFESVQPVIPATPAQQAKDDYQVDKVKIIFTKDNSVVEGFMKDNANYVPVAALKELGLIKATWDNVNKKLYIS